MHYALWHLLFILRGFAPCTRFFFFRCRGAEDCVLLCGKSGEHEHQDADLGHEEASWNHRLLPDPQPGLQRTQVPVAALQGLERVARERERGDQACRFPHMMRKDYLNLVCTRCGSMPHQFVQCLISLKLKLEPN